MESSLQLLGGTTDRPESSFPMTFPALSIPVRMGSKLRLSGKGVGIAMIDSGFVPHPDLVQPHNRIARYYDAVHKKEEELPPSDPQFFSWHGTMTACTAAGNGFLSRNMYTSLAYEAHVVLIRAMDDRGAVPTSIIVHGLEWCLQNKHRFNIRVINLSVYADELDFSLQHPVTRLVEELSRQGVVVVAASGNDVNSPMFPPAVSPSAITVGGLDDRNTLDPTKKGLYHSSFGRLPNGQMKPEIIAPAIWLPAPILPKTKVHDEASALCALDAMTDEMLLQTLPLLITKTQLPLELIRSSNADEIRHQVGNRLAQEKIISRSYKHVDGTSFAAPIVCSVIAQMLEANPRLQPQQVKEIITSTARPVDGYPRERQGYGVIQVQEALQKAFESKDWSL